MIPAAWIAHGVAVALSWWGPRPPTCGPHVPVVQRPIAGRYAIAQADGFRCRIVLDSKPWTPWTRSRVCKAIVHERGHLLGHGHSRNPRSIMYRRLHYWRPCE